MSDKDIRNQLEGLFSDIVPESDQEKKEAIPAEASVSPAQAGPAEAELTAPESAPAAQEAAIPIEQEASWSATEEHTGSPVSVSPDEPAPSFPRAGSGRTQSRAGGLFKAWANLSMRIKFAVVFLTVTLLAVATVALLNVSSSSAALTAHVAESLEDLAAAEAQTIADTLVKHVEAMQGFSRDVGLKASVIGQNGSYSGTATQIEAQLAALDEAWIAASDDDPLIQGQVNSLLAGGLKRFKDVVPDFAEAFVTDGFGGLVAASDRTSDYYQADEGWWQAAYNDGQGAVFIAEPELDESTGVVGVDIAVPIFDGDEVVGVLRTTLDVTALVERLSTIKLGATGGAHLQIGETPFAGHEEHEGHEGHEEESGDEAHQLDPASLARMGATSQGHVEGKLDGVPSMVGYATVSSLSVDQSVSDLDWKVVLHQDRGEALAAVAQQTRNSVLVALVIAGAAVATAVVMGQVLANPITNLTNAVTRFAAGERDVRVEAKSGDEIGTLAQTYNSMADQIDELFSSIEQRVAQRTRARMELAAEVGRRLSTVRDLDELLAESVELIKDSFDLYHVQVYLTDLAGRYLTLRAGTGEVGAELVRRSHSLPVSLGSINGAAAAQKQAVIVSDTAQSETFLPNPLLPDTRSEMAVPLLVGERVVGVLDLQSARPGSLSADNLSAFEALSGQLAIAIDNARLFSETAQAQAAVEAQIRRLAHEGWEEFLDGVEHPEHIGYTYALGELEPTADPLSAKPDKHVMATEIQVQGAPVGAIHIEDEAGRNWTEADAELVESVARQIAQQAESLRIVAQADQYRAQAEQVTRRLTREGWQEYLEAQAASVPGYAYDLFQVKPLDSDNGADESALAQPLKVQGEPIGQLAIAETEALDDEAAELITSVAERLSAHVENLRLLEETERRGHELAERTRELEASQRVTFAASERTNPDDLLGLVVNLIRDQFDLYHVQVYIVDEGQNAALLRESTGYAGRQLLQEGHHIPLDRPALVTRAIREGEPVLVTDVTQDPNFMPNPLLPDTQSELVVPLKIGDRVIGALDAQDRVAGRFSQNTAALFQTMTDQIAFLFENSELVERITEQTEQLTLFAGQLRTAADIAQRLSTVLDPERLLGQVVEMLQSRYGLYHAHVYLLDAETGQLSVQAGSGEVGRVLRERSHTIAVDNEKSLVARAARTREIVSVEDTSIVSDFMPNPLLPQTRSELALPLVAGDEVLGVLDLQDDRAQRFTEADRDTFSTLAGQVATALQNAGLFEQVEMNARQVQMRFEISQALASAETEEDVLDTIIQKAGLYPQTQLMIFTNFMEGEEEYVVARRIKSFETKLASMIEPGVRFPMSQFRLINQQSGPGGQFVSPNLPEDERADAVSREMARQMGTASMAVLPMMAGDEQLGSIAVSSENEGYFDEHKLYLYQTLAEQGAATLQAARLRDAMQESEQRFRTLVENAPDAIVVLDADANGQFIDVNENAVQLYGLERQELVKVGPVEMSPPTQPNGQPSAEAAVSFIQEALEGGTPIFEWVHRNAAGEDFPCEVRLVRMPAAGRNLVRGSVTDIAERKRADQERERFTTQLRTAADMAEQINAILEPDRLLSEVANQLQARFGLYHVHIYLLDESKRDLVLRAGSGAVGQTLLEQGHRIPFDREQSIVARAARTREIISVEDTRLEPEFMANPLLPDTRSEVAVPLVAGNEVLGVLDVQDNQPYRFTASDLDVFSTLTGQTATALQNADFVVEMQRTAERLREVDKLKSEFLASMSHELRTPLNSIIGFAEVLLMGISGELPAEISEDIQAIYDNGQHLLRIINDILDLAKIEAGTMSLSLEPVDVAPLLEEIKTNTAGLLVNKPIELLIDVEHRLAPISVDPVRLNQILTNLVSNAVKFTQEGTVTMSAFSDNGWACIEVRDTGIGIKDEDLDKIFERFRQVDGSSARRAEGSGLGLAITRNLVELHGGTLDVHSQLGEGSTFTVRLPIQQTETIVSEDGK